MCGYSFRFQVICAICSQQQVEHREAKNCEVAALGDSAAAVWRPQEVTAALRQAANTPRWALSVDTCRTARNATQSTHKLLLSVMSYGPPRTRVPQSEGSTYRTQGRVRRRHRLRNQKKLKASNNAVRTSKPHSSQRFIQYSRIFTYTRSICPEIPPSPSTV